MQHLRALLRCGCAGDPRLPPNGQAGLGDLTHDSPEVRLMRQLRYNTRALQHVTAAFTTIWSGCAGRATCAKGPVGWTHTCASRAP